MNHDHLEEQIRSGLAERAAEVEPGPNAYARLAERLTRTPRPARWWRSARMLWLTSAGLAAAAVLVVTVLAARTDDRDSDIVATAPTPIPTLPGAVPTPPPHAAQEDNKVPVGVIWPVGTPDDTWPTSPEEAARRFFAEVIGVADVPVGEANDSFVEIPRRGENGEPLGLAANVGFTPVGDRFGITEISSPEVMIEEVSRTTDGRISVRGIGRGFEGTVVGRLWSGTDLVEPAAGRAGAAADLVPFELLLQPPEATGPVVVIVQTSQGADTDVPAVAALAVEAFPTVEDLYSTAAEQLVSSVTGWVLPATSLVQGGADAVVTLGNGVTEVSVLRDGFTPIAARSDQIVVDSVEVEAGVVSIRGEADSVGDLRVDIYHSLAGPPELFASGFAVHGGANERRRFEATLQLRGPADGNSYVVLYDLGPGDIPIALTLLPVDLREPSQ